jgi:hypothetical protein
VTVGRRSAVSSLAFTLFGFPALLAAQWDRLPSAQPNPRQPPRPVPPGLASDPHPDPKQALQENLKQLRLDVDQLVQLVQDLKTETDKTNQTNVLSVSLIHKTDEIERLAKQIKSLARAS